MARQNTALVIATVLVLAVVGNFRTLLIDWNSYTFSTPSSSTVYDWTEQRMRSSSNNSPAADTAFASLQQEGTNTTYCARWDEETDLWWVHRPMWDIWKENSTHTCFYYNPTYTYEHKIYRNQFHNRCTNNTYTRCMWSSGWAADFENVIFPLMYSVDKGQPYALFNPAQCWHYAANRDDCSQPTCSNMDMSCYFLQFGKCPPVEAQVVTDWDVITTSLHEHLSNTVYFYVTRQQQWVRQAVYNEVKKHVDHIPRGRCAVMHVRRGDIVLHGEYARKYYPISDYVALLPPSRRDNIFLLTDDANAVSEALEFYPDINWYYFERKRHKGTEGGWENQTPSKNPKQEVITILSTFQLVQRCDTFVHSESGFATDILRYLHKAHPTTVKQFRVDNKDKEKRSIKHNNSDAVLAELLNEQRRKGRATNNKRLL